MSKKDKSPKVELEKIEKESTTSQKLSTREKATILHDVHKYLSGYKIEASEGATWSKVLDGIALVFNSVVEELDDEVLESESDK